ncbi:MAG: hypothetical protein AAGF11_49220 [Myxococcota bacterium]
MLRTLMLRRVPDVATISRTLAGGDARSVDNARKLARELLLERMETERLPRVTADFDGSALSTTRKAEGTAVGFNKKRNGVRSYYPLFCVVAQLGMFFDMQHRPSNAHDSRGAKDLHRAVHRGHPGSAAAGRRRGATSIRHSSTRTSSSSSSSFGSSTPPRCRS